MPPLRPGTNVEIRSSFDGSWIDGFAVVGADDDGTYRLRRLSDGEVLPTTFPPADVRRQRKRQTWWV